MEVSKIRNIAIIAHVDHGKTTLVDKLLHAGHLFKAHENPGELIMDSKPIGKGAWDHHPCQERIGSV